MAKFEKLLIEKQDEPKTQFHAQYNPERYSIDKVSTWNERGRRATLQYGGRGRKSVTFELFFDTYATRTDKNSEDFEDVRTKYVNDLLALMEPSVETSTGNKRPPILIVSWGGFALKSVLERLSQNYTLFSQSGIPVRAIVTATFKQFSTAEEEARNSAPGDPSKTHIVVEGETLSLIAYKEYGDATLWRVIARENQIDDALKIVPGESLTIPALL